MRLIDVDELKKILLVKISICEHYGELDTARELRGLNSKIDDMHTIEVEPVVHGHWKHRILTTSKTKYANVISGVYICSICGRMTKSKSTYCGNCGAKMDKD